MLSTDNQQELMVKRIEKTVATLMEERPFFKEELDYEEMIQHLVETFDKYVGIEKLLDITDDDLKERCSGILSTQLLVGMLDNFTPEQIAIFDEAIRRK